MEQIKRFKCKFCKKTFGRKIHMMTHIHKHCTMRLRDAQTSPNPPPAHDIACSPISWSLGNTVSDYVASNAVSSEIATAPPPGSKQAELATIDDLELLRCMAESIIDSPPASNGIPLHTVSSDVVRTSKPDLKSIEIPQDSGNNPSEKLINTDETNSNQPEGNLSGTLINIEQEPTKDSSQQLSKLINIEQDSGEAHPLTEQLINTQQPAMNIPVRKGFVCPTCGNIYKRKKSLERHNREAHKANCSWTCPHCPYTSSRRHNLIRHKNDIHSEVPREPVQTNQPMEIRPAEAIQPEPMEIQSETNPIPQNAQPVDNPPKSNPSKNNAEPNQSTAEADLYQKFFHLIEDHVHPGKLQDRYNVNLASRTVPEALDEIFSTHTRQFKCNIGYGFILRHKITGQLSYYYASHNTLLFNEPAFVGNPTDLAQLKDKIKEADVLQHTFHQRPDTRYVVHKITNAIIYVTKMIKYPIGDPGESEFEEYLLKSKSVKSMLTAHNGTRYSDQLCFFRCLAYARKEIEIERAAHRLLGQWTSELFDGVTMDDLDQLEQKFNLKIYVYTLVSNERSFGDDGDINELLIAEAEAAEEEEVDIPPISAQIIRRSIRTTGDVLNLNCNHGHFSLITKLGSFVKSWRCSKCDKLFDLSYKYHRHENTCDAKVKYIYPGGGHGLPPTVFDQLADEGILVENQIYPYHVTYDFECLFTPLDQGSAKLHYTNKLSPVSFSIASNVPSTSTITGKPFTDTFCVIDEPNPLMEKFYAYLEEISEAANSHMREQYEDLISYVESKQVNVYQLRRELRIMKKDQVPHLEIQKQQVRIREARKWTTIKERLETWLWQLPAVGFNSGKFDFNLIRSSLVPLFIRNKIKVNVIKKGNNYMVVSTPQIIFIDICNYLAPGTSYAKWLKGFNVPEQKGIFPYSWLTAIENLDQDHLPSHEGFYSTLRNQNISTKQYKEAQAAWSQNNCRTMRDYLTWYNNLDVVPFLEALTKMKKHWKQYNIDMLKGGAISLPGLAYLHMFKTTKKDVIIPLINSSSWYQKIRDNIVGGPSIIFNRYQEVDKTKIKDEKPVKNIVGYDANSLYLWCIGQNMPTGHYGILEPTTDRPVEPVPTNPVCINPRTIDDMIARNLSREFKRTYGLTSSLEEYVWCEWMRQKLSRNSGKELTLRHYVYGNQKVINIGHSSLPVDGYIPELGVILQYHGCFFHGHSCVKNGDPLLMQQRRDQTNRVREQLKSTGLRLIEMYQCKFYSIMKSERRLRALYQKSKLPMPGTLKGSDIINGIRQGTFFGVVECDLQVPWWIPGMRKKFEEMTPIFKNTDVNKEDIGNHMRNYAEETNIMSQPRRCLIGSYFGEKITLITPLLQWYLAHGLVITNIYSALQYKPQRCFQHLVDEVAEQRREADKNPDMAVVGEQAKLRGNSFYGKCITDLAKHMDVSFMTERDAAEAVNGPWFRKLDEVTDRFYEISSAKKKIVFKLPIIIAYFVYGYAKLRMLEFHYDFIDKFIDRSDYECMSMDTDSLYMAISGTNIASIIKPYMQQQFDADLTEFLATDAYSQRTPGLFKLEYEGNGMVALNSKTYSIWKDDGRNKYSSKGLSKSTNALIPAQFIHVLDTQEKISGINTGFRMLNGSLAQYTQGRDGLTYLYIKRRVREDGIGTDPLLI